jgi:hypothetical protein
MEPESPDTDPIEGNDPPAEGEPGSDTEPGQVSKDKEVPIENRFAEVRKYNKQLRERMDSMDAKLASVSELNQKFEKFLEQQRSPHANTPQLSDDQLRTAWQTDPAKYGFQAMDMLVQRRVDEQMEKVREEAARKAREQIEEANRVRYNELAVERYEDLADPDSAFFHEVDRAVAIKRQEYNLLGKELPHDIVLSTANEVALARANRGENVKTTWSEMTRSRAADRSETPLPKGGSKPTSPDDEVKLTPLQKRVAEKTGRSVEHLKKFISQDPQSTATQNKLKREGKL